MMTNLLLLILAIAFLPENPCDLTLFNEFISSFLYFPTIGQENLLSLVFTITLYKNDNDNGEKTDGKSTEFLPSNFNRINESDMLQNIGFNTNNLLDFEHSLITKNGEITYRSTKKFPSSEPVNNNDNTELGSSNCYTSSPLENGDSLEDILMVLTCMKIILILGIISFILYSLYIYIYNNNKINDYFENKFIIKFIYLVKKSAKVYTLFWGLSTFFYLNSSLYLVFKIYKVLSMS